MADRYWVGGTATWDSVAGTKWATTSGGTGGASVPTTADSVFFDQVSTYTVALGSSINCLDFTVSAGTVTFTGGSTLNIYGSFFLATGTTTWSHNGTLAFQSSLFARTITTNGTTISGGLIVQVGSGSLTLGSALTVNSTISHFSGTFSTSASSYSIATAGYNGTFTQGSLNLNASTITTSSAYGNPYFTFGSSISQSLSSATFLCAANSPIITYNGSGGLNLGSWQLTNTGISDVRIFGVGEITFNSLAISAHNNVPFTYTRFRISSNISINNFSTVNTAGNRRIHVYSQINGNSALGVKYKITLNGTYNLTDIDFENIDIVYGGSISNTISGTRLGNCGNVTGVQFSAPKTVYLSYLPYWDQANWSATSGGATSADNYPLPQDTAVIDNTATSSITLSTDTKLPTVDVSTRTTAFTLTFSSSGNKIFGDWTGSTAFTFGSGGFPRLTFNGKKFQTIKSNGQTSWIDIYIESLNGTILLADAFTAATGVTLDITSGTFDTNGYALTVGRLQSSYNNIREINLRASTVTLTSAATNINFTNNTNLTFNAGTSTINVGPDSGNNWHDVYAGTPNTIAFYTLKVEGSQFTTSNFTGNCTFNNLILSHKPSTNAEGEIDYTFTGTQVITGTLSCTNTATAATGVKRIGIISATSGTQVNLTVNAWGNTATDISFKDINLIGAVGVLSGVRLGDCGNNTNITFPSPKTVYWVGTGLRYWYSSNSYAPTSGGTPDITNFPLPQDTLVIDNASGASPNISFFIGQQQSKIGTINAVNRTTSATIAGAADIFVHGDFTLGTGITWSHTGALVFQKAGGTQTINTNGITLPCPISIFPGATLQLGGALTTTKMLIIPYEKGSFDAVTYNVTVLNVDITGTSNSYLRMGSGTWTVTGTGTVWFINGSPIIYAGTSTVVLSDNSATARTFSGNGTYYNKITIGGTTGSSTTTFNGSNIIGELASTKTVAHTIAFGSTIHTFGKWSVTGTAGNVVTITGTSTANVIAGPAVTGVDYLAMGTWGISTSSPGEFYAGANSTGTAAAPVFRTAAPTPRTLYWVGGTGNWSDAAKWSTTSGGTGGAAIPTSLDLVNFNSASSASAYTATVDAGVTIARCAAIAMGPPASGNITFAGSIPIAFHGTVIFNATGITRTYTGAIQLSGNSNYYFTTNGIILSSSINVNGIGSTWTLGSALDITLGTLTVTSGSFNTSASSYALSLSVLSSSTFLSNSSAIRSINLNASVVTAAIAGTSIPINFTWSQNLTFNAGTSQFNFPGSTYTINGGGVTFYNVAFNTTTALSFTINGQNTFNTLLFGGRTTVGIGSIIFSANQTIGTLTLAAGTAAAYRTFLASNTLGTQRTLAVTTLTAGAADIDFRDIAVTGTTLTGTRFGDCKGNSGITFPAAKTVYYATSSASNWGSVGTGSWSLTNNGTADATAFPLAQDTAVFPSSPTPYPASGTIVSINADYNIGTIDMSARTTNTMTLQTLLAYNTIYGNWISGTGVTMFSSQGLLTFAGRGNQTITSAGVAFPKPLIINTPSGSVTLQDALILSFGNTGQITVLLGTFNANNYNVTFTYNSTYSGITSDIAGTRTIAFGSGTWTILGASIPVTIANITGLTITGTATINLTSSFAKTFAGGGANYSGITLNQGGAGALTITGNNTFKNISNSYGATGVTTINLDTTTQTVEQFTALPSTNLLIINGSDTPNSTTGTAKLRLTGSANVSMTSPVAVTAVQFYSGTDTGSWINFDYSSSIVKGYSIFKKLLKPFKAFGDFFTFFS
jgi:hypothetical protein